ncbi:MAG: isoprenylcysteine carboxylmethyltransferase family protein [Silicimonas sp.]|nr:isoprenylcysteine carboxylmethyltransferase family protein [Silicimonas sp.]
MKWIDVPPAWLLVCLAQAWIWRWPTAWDGEFWPGLVCLGVAGLLMLDAFVRFVRAKTTIIPRQRPDALITDGIFRWTRNPIYLADVLILAGFSLIWGSVLGLLLVPVLGALLQKRFILAEEAKLADAFGDVYHEYARQTRRWL